MKKLSRNLFLGLMIGSLGILPVFASADDDKGKNRNERDQVKIEKQFRKEAKKREKEKAKEERKNEKKNKSCLKAWGHLIAFGWLNKNSSVEVDLENCSIPFGIAKKLSNGGNSSTPDTVAPTISNIRIFTSHTSAIIAWDTNEKTSGKVYYSSTTPVNINTASVIKSTKGLEGKSHFVSLGGLATGTTYYFIVEAKDKAGNTSTSTQSSFVTKSVSTPIDLTAPIISATSTAVSSTTITVNWTTSEPSTSKVYYSTTTPINTSLSYFVLNASLITNHSIKIEGLSSSTLYHLLIESKDSATNTATSTQFSTTTSAQ